VISAVRRTSLEVGRGLALERVLMKRVEARESASVSAQPD
jgi:hypothetical protein